MSDLLWSILLEFGAYLRKPATLQAVLLPAAIGLFLWRRSKTAGSRLLHIQAFVLGTALSILCSVWVEREGVLSLHMLPGYALTVVLAPKAYRPSAPRVYVLCFLSLLLADLSCAAWYALANNGDISSFYRGVGGAGFHDALFIVPSAIAIYVSILTFVESSPIAHIPVWRIPKHVNEQFDWHPGV